MSRFVRAVIAVRLFIWVADAAAQAPTRVWETLVHNSADTFPGTGVLSIRPLADGSFVAVGEGRQGTRFSARHSLNGTEHSVATFGPERSGLYRVDDFGALVVGTETRNVTFDLEVRKRDGTTGAALWARSRVLDGPQHLDDRLEDVLFDPRGDVVVAGTASVSSSSGEANVWKLDGLTGRVLWGPVVVSSIRTSYDPVLLRCDRDGNVLVLATSAGPGLGRLLMTKLLSATGSPAAVTPDPGIEAGVVQDAVVGANGEVVVTTELNGAPAVLALSGWSGERLWGPVREVAFSEPRALAIDARGRVTMCATKSAAGGELSLFHYDGRTGDRLWGPVALSATSSTALLAVNAAGHVFTAATVSNAEFSTDIQTASFDEASGAIRWGPVVYDGPARQYDKAGALAVDPEGGILVGGVADTFKAVAFRYDGDTGAPLFAPRFVGRDRPESGESAWSGEVGPSGDLFVVSEWGTDDAAVTRFDGRSGRIIWGPTPLGLTRQYAAKLRLSPNGDVVVSGGGGAIVSLDSVTGAVRWTHSTTGSRVTWAIGAGGDVYAAFPGNDEIVVERIVGSTGASAWGPVGVPASVYEVSALGVNASGDFVISCEDLPTLTSLLAYKLDGATGALVWGPIDIPAFMFSGGQVLFDSSGDAVIATNSQILKLRGGNGDLLWGPVSAPGVTTYGFIGDLVLDASGDVIAAAPYATTFRLSGATGNVLWSAPAPGSLVRLSSSGSAFVLGGNIDDLLGSILVLSKLDAATGALAWTPVRLQVGRVPAALGVAGRDPLFAGTIRDGAGLAAYRYADGLTLLDETRTPDVATCGRPYSFPFAAANGTVPLSWALEAGSLPPGITLSPDGVLAGTTTQPGDYWFAVRIGDASGQSVVRDALLRVIPLSGAVAIAVSRQPACDGPDQVLSVAGSYDAYRWLPGGETTPTLIVRPAERTTYAVDAASGTCVSRGSVTVAPAVTLPPPFLVAPASWVSGAPGLTASCTPRAGSSYAWTIDNGSIDSGQGSDSVQITPAFAGRLHVEVVETDASGCMRPGVSRVVQIVSSAGGTLFYPLRPCRAVDSRVLDWPVDIGSSRGLVYLFGGLCEIPFGARALAANVTVTGSTGAGALRFVAGRRPPTPDLDLISFMPGQTRAVNTLIGLLGDSEGAVTFYAVGNGGRVHVIVDVTGYFR